MISLTFWNSSRDNLNLGSWQLQYYNVTTNLLIFLLFSPLAESSVIVWNCDHEIMKNFTCGEVSHFIILCASFLCITCLYMQNFCNIIFYNNRAFRSLDFLSISEVQCNIYHLISFERLLIVFSVVFQYQHLLLLSSLLLGSWAQWLMFNSGAFIFPSISLFGQ